MGHTGKFLVVKKREGWVIHHWPLTLQGVNWSQPMCPGLCHVPERAVLSLPGHLCPGDIQDPWRKMSGNSPFFSPFI